MKDGKRHGCKDTGGNKRGASEREEKGGRARRESMEFEVLEIKQLCEND